ncbi:hypothetical protein ACFQZZ_01765 [Nocardia sp. GCM10030253]|uniref:hypothetical protein n=1 Tax=Nocardia sp. GCM10030253 TaxID=3273404 RepID=UPI00363F20BC
MMVVALLVAMGVALLAGIAFGVLMARDEQAALREVSRRQISDPSRRGDRHLRAHLLRLEVEEKLPVTIEPRLRHIPKPAPKEQTPI